MSSLPVLPGLTAHPSGALWLSELRTAIIADLHLGYSWAQRRKGELGPLADVLTKEKVLRVTSELRPETLVFLGDLVHAPRPCAAEREWIEGLLMELSAHSTLVAVRGNHDRAFAREFGSLPIDMTNAWQTNGITAIHGDRLDVALPEQDILLMGHLHPALTVRDAAGAGQRLPLFLVNPHCLVLPAFSPFAGGYDMARGLSSAVTPLFRHQEIDAYAATGKRIVKLGPLQQAIARVSAANPNAPSQFRGHRRRRVPAL